MRATERLFLKADSSAIVTENDRTPGNVLVAEPGDEIPDAIADIFGLLKLAAKQEALVKTVGLHIRHSDATGKICLCLPARALLLDVFVICTQSAVGAIRPSIDFGEKDGDTDGILSGIGQVNVCDVPSTNLELSPDFVGRGALITSMANQGPLRMKVTKFYPEGVTLQNVCNVAGTCGEWDIFIMYIQLPEVV